MWLIPGAPLAAAIVIALLGPKLLRERSHWPCWIALAIAAICSFIAAARRSCRTASRDTRGRRSSPPATSCLDIGGFNVRVDLRADAMTALMLSMVTSVSFLVAIFAAGYMHGDPGYPRFFAAISLFVFSMCMLVLAGNFLLLFIFWEGGRACAATC